MHDADSYSHQVLWFSTSEVAGQWYEPGKYGLFQEYLFAYGAEGTEGSLNIYLAEGSGDLHTQLCSHTLEPWDAPACTGDALRVLPAATRHQSLGDDAWHMCALRPLLLRHPQSTPATAATTSMATFRPTATSTTPFAAAAPHLHAHARAVRPGAARYVLSVSCVSADFCTATVFVDGLELKQTDVSGLVLGGGASRTIPRVAPRGHAPPRRPIT